MAERADISGSGAGSPRELAVVLRAPVGASARVATIAVDGRTILARRPAARVIRIAMHRPPLSSGRFACSLGDAAFWGRSSSRPHLPVAAPRSPCNLRGRRDLDASA